MNSSDDYNPTPSVKSWAHWFDRAAQVFDDPRMKIAYYRDGQTGEPYSYEAVEATLNYLWKKLHTTPTSRVLDLGCGVGFFTKKFLSHVKEIVGTDIAPNMIAAARQLNPKGKFLVCRADALPFRDRPFDRVLCYGVTQYLPSESTAQKMLDEIFRVVKPGGRILIGDILEPVHSTAAASYNRATPKGKRWWPQVLDHDLSKLYLPRRFFENHCQRRGARCEFFEQKIPGRHLPTPRYEVVITLP